MFEQKMVDGDYSIALARLVPVTFQPFKDQGVAPVTKMVPEKIPAYVGIHEIKDNKLVWDADTSIELFGGSSIKILWVMPALLIADIGDIRLTAVRRATEGDTSW